MRYHLNNVRLAIFSGVNNNIATTEDVTADVMTLDEHEAVVAEMEAEIEDACADHCRWCADGLPVERRSEHFWVHQHGNDLGVSRCHSYGTQERRHQRHLKGSK